MPLAILAILFGSILLVAGAKGQSLQSVALGQTDKLPDASPADFGSVGNTLSGPGGLGDTLLDTADAAGLVTFDGVKIAGWIKPYLVYGRAHGWTGHVTSGYRSRAEQQAIYNSGVRPAADPSVAPSNHQGAYYPAGAVDVTAAAELSDILVHKPGGSALVWAGAKDPVHFSHPHNGSY